MGKGEEKKITLLRGGKFSFPTELCRLVRTKFSREELRYTLKYTYIYVLSYYWLYPPLISLLFKMFLKEFSRFGKIQNVLLYIFTYFVE